MFMMCEDGIEIGRYKVRKLMSEMKLISKQPGSHAYKKATVERPDIPNVLGREFTVSAPNEVWYGDITYVWAQGRWHYVAVVIDLFARRVVGWAFSSKPDADLVIKALDVAYEQRGRPQKQQKFPPAPVALPVQTEHEPTRKLPRQCANGTTISQLENGMAAERGLHERFAGTAGYRSIFDAEVQLAKATSIQRRPTARRSRGKT